ncbi:hypothetical protein IT401_01495 [Candidatus Nomurabacteria bacterium]|nr:hypothetical protein [Candidatus Nomurabacteria bacterium]
MKTLLKIICALAVLVGVVWVVRGMIGVNDGSVPEVSVSDTSAPAVSGTDATDGTYCFSKNLNKDVTDVTLTIAGDTVTGTMNWIPWEKDNARGTLAGTLLPNGEIQLLYDYMIEGSHQTEEKIMKIEYGKLLIKHGELTDPKYDGHLVYKDASTAVYNEVLEKCE